MEELTIAIVELYRSSVSNIPDEITSFYTRFQKNANGNGLFVIDNILQNIDVASKNKIAVCQDTGIPYLFVRHNKKFSTAEIKKSIIDATVQATQQNLLRPNAVDPIKNENSEDNKGIDFPVIYFEEHENDNIMIELLLKGGGSENIGLTYSLPDKTMDAHRDIDGIKKCVIDAILKAQGKGCPPYIISVGIGGSKDVVAHISKKGLLRKIEDKNPDATLNALEEDLLTDINNLKIGPMGLGGDLTALKVIVNKASRHPATFFVEVCFSCWALRRGALEWN